MSAGLLLCVPSAWDPGTDLTVCRGRQVCECQLHPESTTPHGELGLADFAVACRKVLCPARVAL